MNTKWNTTIVDKIKRKLVKLDRELQLSFADSTDHTVIQSVWLQGGIMNRVRGPITNLYNPDSFYKDKLRK